MNNITFWNGKNWENQTEAQYLSSLGKGTSRFGWYRRIIAYYHGDLLERSAAKVKELYQKIVTEVETTNSQIEQIDEKPEGEEIKFKERVVKIVDLEKKYQEIESARVRGIQDGANRQKNVRDIKKCQDKSNFEYLDNENNAQKLPWLIRLICRIVRYLAPWGGDRTEKKLGSTDVPFLQTRTYWQAIKEKQIEFGQWKRNDDVTVTTQFFYFNNGQTQQNRIKNPNLSLTWKYSEKNKTKITLGLKEYPYLDLTLEKRKNGNSYSLEIIDNQLTENRNWKQSWVDSISPETVFFPENLSGKEIGKLIAFHLFLNDKEAKTLTFEKTSWTKEKVMKNEYYKAFHEKINQRLVTFSDTELPDYVEK